MSGVITLEFSIHVEFVLVDSIGRGKKKERNLIGFKWRLGRGWGGNEKREKGKERERGRERGREKENRSRDGGNVSNESI